MMLMAISYSPYRVIAQDAVVPLTTTDIQNDIDTYATGKLNGQDGWSNGWNSPQVEENIAFEGQNALQNQSGFGTASYKALDQDFFQAGVVSIRLRIDNNSFSDNQDIFGLYKGISEEFVALFRFGNNFDNRQNMLLLSIAESAEVQEIGTITQGTWHKISLGWRNTDSNIRLKIDDTQWTPWFHSQTTWSQNGPLGIKVALPDARTYGDFYVDEIQTFVGYEEPIEEPLVLATSTATDALRQLSISLSTTSITANLDDGLIVVASLDGNPQAPTSSSSTETEAEADTGTSVGQFLLDIAKTVVDIFTGGTDTTSPPTEAPLLEPQDSVPVENTVPSSVQADTENNDVTTTTF